MFCVQVVGSLDEVYRFMQAANTTLEASLEEPAPPSAHSSLPPSVKSTPRALPGSTESSLARMESKLSHGSADKEAAREAARLGAEEAKRQRLYRVMACMRDLRKRADSTEAMFKPLEETAGLLGRCGVHVDDAVLQQLEKGPREWKTLLNKMFRWACRCMGACSVGCCAAGQLLVWSTACVVC